MLKQSTNYQLSRVSCSRFLDSRELPYTSARAAFLSKEEQQSSFHTNGISDVHHQQQQQQQQHKLEQAWPLSGLSFRGISILRGSNDAACVEQLLLHCATALETSDITLAQQIMWVLNNIASTEGDPNQRVAAWFLKGLISRASRTLPPSFLPGVSPGFDGVDDLYFSCLDSFYADRVMSPIQLAKFLDLTPWHRFGFSAANGAILEAVGNRSKVHILDFSISHCMQWPTLIEAFSNRPQGPPSSVRLSVLVSRPCVPPFVDMSYEELGIRLCMFARSKRVNLEFQTIVGDAEHLEPCMLDLRGDEVIAVNCQMRLHYISEELQSDNPMLLGSPRDGFMHMIRSLQPDIVTLVEEDVDVTSNRLVDRLKAAFNHLWIPFDLLESCLSRKHELRMQYEADVGRKIENIVACDGEQRIERLESREKWCGRMMAAQFRQIEFSQDVCGDVKSMLEQHATGWGLKREDGSLTLTWKGHNVVFASAWTI